MGIEIHDNYTLKHSNGSIIIKNIFFLDPTKKFIPEKTLIFFDELQEYPEISTSLKFFYIDGRND